MTKEQARKILIEYQDWRKGQGKYAWREEGAPPFPYSASDLTEAIDLAIKHLCDKGEHE